MLQAVYDVIVSLIYVSFARSAQFSESAPRITFHTSTLLTLFHSDLTPFLQASIHPAAVAAADLLLRLSAC